MVARVLFLSAAAFMAYRYIRSSNTKVAKQLSDKRGSVEILPPGPRESAAVTEGLSALAPQRRLSPAEVEPGK